MTSPAGIAAITVVGSLATEQLLTVQRVPDAGENVMTSGLYIRCGGKGANVSLAASRLSRQNPNNINDSALNTSRTFAAGKWQAMTVRVSLVGAVGNDTRSEPLLKNLKANGVSIDGVQIVQGQETGLAVCVIDQSSGENRLFITPGANHHLAPQDFLTIETLHVAGRRPDLVITNFVIRRDTAEQVLRTAFSDGIKTLLNPSPAGEPLQKDIYRSISHLIMNRSEAAVLSGRQLKDEDGESCDAISTWFLEMGVENIIITLGARGAYYADSVGLKGLVEASPGVEVVDTTGAGDTFIGAYAAETVRQQAIGICDIRAAVEYGCKASARTVETLGSQESIPWADEINR